MNADRCLDSAHLADLAEGRFPQDQRDRIESHLSQCSICRTKLVQGWMLSEEVGQESLSLKHYPADLNNRVERILAAARAAPRRRPAPMRRVIAAASVVAAFAIANSLWVGVEPSATTDEETALRIGGTEERLEGGEKGKDSSVQNPGTKENQLDDWTYRDGQSIILEQTRNPSYARTEPYAEIGNPNG